MQIDNYPSNSLAKKEEKHSEERHVEPVVKNPATAKQSSKHKFRDALAGEDKGNVKDYIIFDVVIPALKNLVADSITDGLRMLLFGSVNGGRNGGTDRNGRTSYSSYYNRDPRNSRDRNDRPTGRPSYSYNDMYYSMRGEAEDVLQSMKEILHEYQCVTVSDYYELSSFPADWTDQRYGWTNLSSARVVNTNAGYFIDLPKAIPLER